MELKDWYTPEEVDPSILALMRRQISPKQRKILDYVGVDADNEGTIEREVYIQDNRQMANIRGFTDPSIRLQGLDTEKQVITPYHIRNHYEFEKDSDFTTKNGGVWQVNPAGMRHSQETVLEPARRNLLVFGFLSMINDQQFSYQDPDVGPITVPYQEHIGSLPNPGNWLGGGNFDPYDEVRTMKAEFYKATGQLPNLVFGSPSVLGPWASLSAVEAKFQPQSPDDPDLTGQTFETFQFAGITFVVLYDQYPDQSGGLNPAIKDKHLAVTASEVEGVGGPPMVLRKAANDENEGDASEPYYWMDEHTTNPWSGATYIYDNFIPDVAKKGIVRLWKVQN